MTRQAERSGGWTQFVGREVEITAQQLGALRALLVQESDPAHAPVGYITFGVERTPIELHK